MFQTVVVGADESPTAAEAVRQAIELVKLTGGKLHIVSAYAHQQLATDDAEFAKSLNSADIAQNLLDDLASRARLAGVDVTTHGTHGSPASIG